MLYSKFDKDEYKKELNVVKEEMKMRKPESFIEYLAFSGTVYEHWVDHDEYHKPRSLPYNAVVDYYHQYYVPQNMVISIVSSIPFNTLIRYISTTSFSKYLPCKTKTSPILNLNIGSSSSNCESNFILRPSDGDTVRIEIGVRVCDQNNNTDANILNVLRQIISSTMSSRLFLELREKRGLTYRSGAYMNLYESVGVFVLYAISSVDRLIDDPINRQKRKNGVLPVLFTVLDDLIQHGIKDTELKMAKQNIKDTLQMEYIASGDKAAYNGVRVMLHNDIDILPNSDIYDTYYKGITRTDVNEVIRKYFSPRIYNISLIGGKLPNPNVITEFITPDKK
jgi:predicted Zn-dependent peptidase